MNKKDPFAPLQIKTDRGKVLLVPDPALNFADILDNLRARLDASNGFFNGARIVYDLRGRPFRVEEVKTLRNVLRETAEADVEEVRLGSDIQGLLNWASRALGVTLQADVETAAPVESKPQAVIISHTCRSGTTVTSEAECIIFGDVNPGAEVIAAGNIIVLGKLRGTAHAGCHGDRTARIWALGFEPNQIRIADLIALPPAEDGTKPARMEMAEVRDDRIYVTTL